MFWQYNRLNFSPQKIIFICQNNDCLYIAHQTLMRQSNKESMHIYVDKNYNEFKYNATTGVAATANLLGSFKYSFTFKAEMMAIKTSTTILWLGYEQIFSFFYKEAFATNFSKKLTLMNMNNHEDE